MDKLLQQFYPEQEKAENRILYLEYLKILAAFRHSVKSCVSDIRQNQRMTLNWTHSVA